MKLFGGKGLGTLVTRTTTMRKCPKVFMAYHGTGSTDVAIAHDNVIRLFAIPSEYPETSTLRVPKNTRPKCLRQRIINDPCRLRPPNRAPAEAGFGIIPEVAVVGRNATVPHGSRYL